MDRLRCLAIIPGLIALLAFVLGLYGVGYCQFVAFTAIGIDGTPGVTVYSGIWNYQTYNLENLGVIYQDYTIMKTCSNYPAGTNFDAMWTTAKAFSIMGLVLGGITTFFSVFAGFFSPFSVHKFQLYGASYLICSLFTGLSLLLLGSSACNDNTFITQFGQDQYSTSSSTTEASDLTFQETCSMGPGAQTTIAATVLWLMAGLLSMKTQPPPRRPITTHTHDVTYTKTTDDNGLVMVSEDVVKGQPVPMGGQQNVVEQAV